MDSDDEIETEEEPEWKGVPGCVVLINAYDCLTTNTADQSFKAACEVIRQSMKLTNSRLIGVCLYGVENPNPTNITPNLVEVFPLAPPSLESFKKLISLDLKSLKQAKEFKLSEVLWHCSRLFANCKKTLSDRKVIFLTKLNTPPLKVDLKPTFKRVEDLVYLGINISIINVSEQPYEIDPFYKDFFIAINKGQDTKIPDIVWKNEEIQSLMEQYTHRHLAVARLSLQIDDDLCIGVGVYKLVQPKSMPKRQKLKAESNEILTSNIKLIKTVNIMNEEETQETLEKPLLQSQLLYYQEFGGEKVQFTYDEFLKITNPFEPRMMKLLGFKSSSILNKEKWYYKQCAFLFPTESTIEGSTVAFKALHQACLDTATIAICMLCTRARSKPSIVALSPCQNPFNLNIDVGFDIIYIPFAENVKDVPKPEEHVKSINVQQKEYMKNMLQDLKFNYTASCFENPKIQTLYRAIEALALNEENVEVKDTTKPSSQVFENVDGEIFYNLFGPFSLSTTKRANSSKASEPAAKSRKKDDVIIDEELLSSRLSMQQISKYTVKELKDILNWKPPPKLPALTGLKKNDLIDLVYKTFEH